MTNAATSAALNSSNGVSQKDKELCGLAKLAAVKARKAYSKDYERENPGEKSSSLTVDELNACRLSDDAAFVGMWGGRRWTYVPKKSGKYVTDPRKLFVADEEIEPGAGREWFSDWTADDIPAVEWKRLDNKLASAKVVE